MLTIKHREHLSEPQSGPKTLTLTLASESKLAGSAGMVTSTVRVSTAMTPRGIPPSLQDIHSLIQLTIFS